MPHRLTNVLSSYFCTSFNLKWRGKLHFHKSSETVDNPNPEDSEHGCMLSNSGWFVQSWMVIFQNWRVSLIAWLDYGMEWWNGNGMEGWLHTVAANLCNWCCWTVHFRLCISRPDITPQKIMSMPSMVATVTRCFVTIYNLANPDSHTNSKSLALLQDYYEISLWTKKLGRC